MVKQGEFFCKSVKPLQALWQLICQYLLCPTQGRVEASANESNSVANTCGAFSVASYSLEHF